MPSANTSGIDFFAPAIQSQIQAPLGSVNFSSPSILAQIQSPQNADLLTEPPVLYGAPTSGEDDLLFPPAPIYGLPTSAQADLLSGATTIQVLANNRYYQRVYSSGLGVWCYYTTNGGIDSVPLPAATTPNWTGSIAGYQLITIVAVP